MALTVAQYEQLLSVLAQVPGIVDEMEARSTGAVERVHDWLKLAEGALTDMRQPAASEFAACRARLLEAGRARASPSSGTAGKVSARRAREAAAAESLQRGNDVLQALVGERRAVFDEAERIARQLLAVAALKGLLPASDDGRSWQQSLLRLRDEIASDLGLATAHAHLVGLVGATDALVFLDRALPSVT